MIRKTFNSESAPPPAGTFSVAMQAGHLVFLSGQTPRDRYDVRHGDKPFVVQAKMALDNLEAAANAAGSSLRDAVKVGVFLKDMALLHNPHSGRASPYPRRSYATRTVSNLHRR